MMYTYIIDTLSSDGEISTEEIQSTFDIEPFIQKGMKINGQDILFIQLTNK